MLARATTVILAGALALLVLAGCGGSDDKGKSPTAEEARTTAAPPAEQPGSTPPPADEPPDPNDKRAVAFDCIRNQKRFPAELVGEHEIQVGTPETGPRIEFFLSGGEAEGKQFQGDAQGAEQIGTALLYVNDASDDMLEELEDCLAHV